MGFVAITVALVLKISILSYAWLDPEAHFFNSPPAPSAMTPAFKGPSPEALKLGTEAYQWAQNQDLVKNQLLTLVDFTQASDKKRLWVVDMKTQKIMFTGMVAHGKNSGLKNATAFSNQPGSDESSLGVYITGQTYYGKHGLSLRIDGLEHGINDNARARAIVVHAAPYVTPNYAHAHGYAGRSWGCFALNPQVAPKVINMIKGGSVIFAYAPEELKDANFSTSGL